MPAVPITEDPAKGRFDKYLALNPDLARFPKIVFAGTIFLLGVWVLLLALILWALMALLFP